MKRILCLSITLYLYCIGLCAQWDTTTVSNEVSTTDEIVAPVLRLSNELRIANTFSPTDPSIGTLDNTGYGINIHKTNGIGLAFNGTHRVFFETDGDIVTTAASPSIRIRGTGTGNYQGANLILSAEGVATGNEHASTWFMTHRNTDGTATIEFQRRNIAAAYRGSPLLYQDGAGWRFDVANSKTSTGVSAGLRINNVGSVGIGTASPQAKLHVSSGNSGDAILRLEADKDNIDESHNSGVALVQDGGLVNYFMEIEGNAGTKSPNTVANALVIGTEENRDIHLINGDEIQMTIKSSGVGVGTASPQTKLHVSSGNSGDAILRLEADKDNIDESHNSGVALVQDGGLVNYFMEIEGNAGTKSPNTVANALVIGTKENRDIHLINGDEIQMTVKNTGVGIGTTVPDAKLSVKGNIHAEEVKVDLSVPGPDYVFKEDYDLKSLEEVQNHIKKHGHLPNIPSAKEMEENGIQLGEMNMKLLEKIEELTLYTLEQEKQLQEKDARIQEIEEKDALQENRLQKIEQLLNNR